MTTEQPTTGTVQTGDLQQGPHDTDTYLPIEEEEERVYIATPLQMMWWRFLKHKMAIIGAIVVILLYVVAIFAEVLAPYNPETYEVALTYAPPQPIHFFHNGEFQGAPFVYGLTQARNPDTLRMEFQIDESVRYPVRFWVEGDPYKLWGFWPNSRHLFGIGDPIFDASAAVSTDTPSFSVIFLLGADKLGRDMFTRIVYGSRVSLLHRPDRRRAQLHLRVVLGGYLRLFYGGVIDVLIQRVIEFIRSVPSIPLWMALSASLPQDWSSIRVYFGITIILSLIGWTFLARAVRGRFLSMREEEFILAARFAGAGEMRIILRHMVPSFFSHLIASATLAVPSMILSETSLSFLGLGLRPPAISWGVLLHESQNLRSVALAPWLLLPGVFVIITVLALNFFGDGLRDAADPYH